MSESKILKICLADNHTLKLMLYKNPIAEYIYHCAKHLKHVPLNFYEQDIFFDSLHGNFDTAATKLIEYGNYVCVEVDKTKLIYQSYLNHLHEIYEKKFDGSPNWLKYHEVIHIIEKFLSNGKAEPIISVNYRHLAGQLEKPFLREYYKHASLKIKKNQCFVRWQELGKPPYFYYKNKEPDNIIRLCELAKPWITLRPSFHIACDDIDLTTGIDLEPFDAWFEVYKNDWCKHWNIEDWDSTEMFKIIPIGFIEDSDQLINHMKKNNFPIKIHQ